MREILIGVILLGYCANAQNARDLLLPEAHHIAGVVVDQDGNAIPEASIDHTNDRRQAHLTDANGRFELETNAPAIVVRKTGYQSALVRLQDATEVRVTLQKLIEKRAFPLCSSAGQYEGIEGWDAVFQFPRIDGVKSAQGRDSDYAARSYYVETPQGPKGVSYGVGPMWSFGLPIDQDVWRSVKYDEVAFEYRPDLMIIDARGQFPNGARWRSLGKFGESAFYRDVDEATAKILDRVLDGACLNARLLIPPAR